MKNTIIVFLISLSGFGVFALHETESQQDEYTQVIKGRANKIVDGLEFPDEAVKTQVRNIIVAHYRYLNDAEEARNADVAKIREEYAEDNELRNAKIDLIKAEQELKTRDHHFAFYAQLKNVISEKQVDQVKDGLTYNVLNVTYTAMCDMIPSLTEEEKAQIKVWLTEAREHAIDGGSSKEKHYWFGKYKGRINNYLSDRGYDLQAERKAWEKRLEEKKSK